jgi:hypothetical protein
MGGVNRDGGCGGSEQAADQFGSWSVDRAALWLWLAEALDRVAATTIDAEALEALRGHVLDTHAPAPLVDAQAAGIALERLVAARIVVAYVERHGCTKGLYRVVRVRALVRQLQGADRGSAE